MRSWSSRPRLHQERIRFLGTSDSYSPIKDSGSETAPSLLKSGFSHSQTSFPIFRKCEAVCLLSFLQAGWDHVMAPFPHSYMKFKVVREWGKGWGPGWVRSQGWVLIVSLWQASECLLCSSFSPMPGLHKKIMYFKNRSCWQVKVKECGMVMSTQSPLQVPGLLNYVWLWKQKLWYHLMWFYMYVEETFRLSSYRGEGEVSRFHGVGQLTPGDSQDWG